MNNTTRAVRRFLNWFCCFGNQQLFDLSGLEILEHEVEAELLSGRD